ncbi:hypothetical protein LTR99_003458 [Exophiala xenobiotica]|uniref:Enoyl reductase (ER) domain-containing protein n=1 Tax=Vermiconidia calcicola TaxID=1690605 RepID=A0AAV9PWM1_9PEZI|nr:hypothetical protein LTR92_009279 [Exophiala xenobiotica]KAK5529170.1 hypothetical protein LTR25_009907 [Vermiconidia calcicola]KAK5547135.1 hypothetical protein LTR23_002774 [Chaetothyriales sp. CCFEE 6169]KAK5266387.1 hypothetical protein LTR96_008234 [Exophiala xenobiotica]KAK5305913.1 hypothetical protein LTR99_003458 [Exophiala xenobiotica]
MSQPTTMKAWRYTSVAGGMEKNLKLETNVPLPPVGKNEVLVEVLSAGLNPADYKVPEIPYLGALAVRRPAVPCADFCGRRVVAGSGGDDDELVFGMAKFPGQHGVLAQYAPVPKSTLVPLPKGLTPEQGAGIYIAAFTAFVTISSYVKPGDTVFINGGSGGVGTFGIQIAKLLGARRVVASCSGANADLVRSLGADEVLDYKTQDLVTTLAKDGGGPKYDVVLDYVGHPLDLHSQSVKFLKKDGIFVLIAGDPSNMRANMSLLASMLWPTFLGGTPRKFKMVALGAVKEEDQKKVAGWIGDGKLKVMVDSVFDFEQAPQAFEKLKTGRAKGKIVISGINP